MPFASYLTHYDFPGVGGLIVSVEETDDSCVVSSDRINTFGVGDSLSEALSDFASSAIEYREGLEAREGELGPVMRAHLEYLRQIAPTKRPNPMLIRVA